MILQLNNIYRFCGDRIGSRIDLITEGKEHTNESIPFEQLFKFLFRLALYENAISSNIKISNSYALNVGSRP